MSIKSDNILRDEDLMGVNGGTQDTETGNDTNKFRHVMCPKCSKRIMINYDAPVIECPECHNDITLELKGIA